MRACYDSATFATSGWRHVLLQFTVIGFHRLFVPRAKSYLVLLLDKRTSLWNKFLAGGEITSSAWNEMTMEGNDSILLELTQKMKLKKNNRYFTRTIPPDAILCALLLQPLKLCTKIRTTSNRIRKIAIMLIARNCLVRIPRHVLAISLAVWKSRENSCLFL